MDVDPVKRMLDSERKQYEIEIQRGERVAGSQIQLGLKDAVFFITGGSGFIGSQLIEKLLRSCPDVKKIYILLRAKKGQSVEERLAKILEDPVYNLLKKLKPDFASRIVAIEGDVQELNLGISEQDRNTITKDTTCIIHAAATIRFDEPLKQAVLINIRGTREALKLGRECKNLKAYVHVSTAYVHIYNNEVHEKFYDSPMKPETIIDLVENMDDEQVERICEGMIHGWPNTYTYTKTIAESAVQQYGKGLPLCIVRPAIVSASWAEPSVGWINKSNMYGPSGLLLGLGLGLIHIIYGNPDVRLELVPVDFVNNLTIAAVWNTCQGNKDDDVKIYTLSSRRNGFLWGGATDCCQHNAKKYVSPKAIWYCYGWLTNNPIVFNAVYLFLHIIPAFFIDIILKLRGSRIRLLRIYNKALKLTKLFSHFTRNQWDFYDDNSMELFNKMSEDDKKMFNFDICTVNMMDYMLNWCLGIRKYIIEDNLNDTSYSRKKQSYLRIAHYILVTLLLRIYNKAFKLSKLYSHFARNQWDFYDDNSMELFNKMSEDDKKMFNFDICTVNMMDFMLNWFIGIRKYIIEDNLSGTNYSRKKQRFLKIAHYILVTLYVYLVYKLLQFIFFGITHLCGW